MSEADQDAKMCPFCGEAIKKVAIRCKHCHAELKEPDFDRGEGGQALAPDSFEQRFLAFAYQTTAPINAPAVAYALKMSIKDAEARLEDLAASDVLVREVDDEGHVFFRLPGRSTPHPSQALVKASPPLLPSVSAAPPPQAMAGLLLNLVMPGVGSIVAGKTTEGLMQLVLILIGFPLCFILIGIPICIATWGWALSTGLRALSEAQSAAQNPGS